MAEFTGVAVTIIRPDGSIGGGVGWECKSCGFLFAHGPKAYLPQPNECMLCDDPEQPQPAVIRNQSGPGRN